MLAVYALVDFLGCLCGWYDIGWLFVCCYRLRGFGGLMYLVFCDLWHDLCFGGGLHVFWLAVGGGLLVYFVIWVVLDFVG